MIEFIISFLIVSGFIMVAGAVETSIKCALFGFGLMGLGALIAYVAEQLGYKFNK